MLVNTLITCLILSFVALFAVVVYFRIRVLRAYGILVRNRIQFDIVHIFYTQRMESEILTKYPEFRSTIVDFARGIRLSVSLVPLFMVLITVFGGLLMYLKA